MVEEHKEKVETSEAEPKVYHLADGIILSLGIVDTCLVDLERNYEVRVDYRYVEPLEKTTLGFSLEGYEMFVPRLLRENILAEGDPQPDSVIQRRLGTLDRMYLRDFEEELSERAKKAYELLLDCHARRKRFFERVGQCPILPETALRRALLVGDAEEVGKKKVLCLGDDDLVSIALATLGHDVTVYDIDDYLLNFLRGISENLELGIQVTERDLRDPIAEDEGGFDIFMTDPMSNRDCFEIFLSRAFSLLKPDGIGYSAVYAPVSRLFHTLAGEMKFEIAHWYGGFNRYYSKYMHLHEYASDWVEIRRTPETVIPHAADQFSVPLNLYREDYYQRHKSLSSFIDEIEDVRRATPFYLLTLLDALEEVTDLKLPERMMHPANDWTVIHCPVEQGYLTLHVDRIKQQILIDMYPFDGEIEQALRGLLMSVYKTGATGSTVGINRSTWDIRLK